MLYGPQHLYGGRHVAVSFSLRQTKCEERRYSSDIRFPSPTPQVREMTGVKISRWNRHHHHARRQRWLVGCSTPGSTNVVRSGTDDEVLLSTLKTLVERETEPLVYEEHIVRGHESRARWSLWCRYRSYEANFGWQSVTLRLTAALWRSFHIHNVLHVHLLCPSNAY